MVYFSVPQILLSHRIQNETGEFEERVQILELEMDDVESSIDILESNIDILENQDSILELRIDDVEEDVNNSQVEIEGWCQVFVTITLVSFDLKQRCALTTVENRLFSPARQPH